MKKIITAAWLVLIAAVFLAAAPALFAGKPIFKPNQAIKSPSFWSNATLDKIKFIHIETSTGSYCKGETILKIGLNFAFNNMGKPVPETNHPLTEIYDCGNDGKIDEMDNSGAGSLSYEITPDKFIFYQKYVVLAQNYISKTLSDALYENLEFIELFDNQADFQTDSFCSIYPHKLLFSHNIKLFCDWSDDGKCEKPRLYFNGHPSLLITLYGSPPSYLPLDENNAPENYPLNAIEVKDKLIYMLPEVITGKVCGQDLEFTIKE